MTMRTGTLRIAAAALALVFVAAACGNDDGEQASPTATPEAASDASTDETGGDAATPTPAPTEGVSGSGSAEDAVDGFLEAAFATNGAAAWEYLHPEIRASVSRLDYAECIQAQVGEGGGLAAIIEYEVGDTFDEDGVRWVEATITLGELEQSTLYGAVEVDGEWWVAEALDRDEDACAPTLSELAGGGPAAPSEATGGGTQDDPLAFGEPVTIGDWTASIVSATDADQAGLVNEFADPPPDGSIYLAVAIDVTYEGDELTAFEPFTLKVLGSRVYESWDNNCFLDDPGEIEFVPGQTGTATRCFEVATEDLDDLRYALESFDDFGGEPTVYVGPIS